MSGSVTLPTVMTVDGPVPQAPQALYNLVLATAQTFANSLGITLTQDLPGSLIEDIGSTDTGAAIVIDNIRVDLINSVTPRGANAFILNQLGQIYGVPLGVGTNTGVFVVFTGPKGYPITKGFTVSDGTFQYVIQDGGVITSSGSTQPLFAMANQPGSWAIPKNTVTQLVTSVPTVINLTVTNPLDGTPSSGPQTEENYRSQVLQAGLATAQGATAYLKTLVNNIPGVQSRLVSVQQKIGQGWEIIVGGTGDPFLIGYAIQQSLFDLSTIVGSTMQVTNITNTNPAVVSVNLNHGFPNGQVIFINGATGMSGVNGIGFPITVVSQSSFTIPLNATALGTYTGNGIVTPNFRNVTTNIFEYPDTYTIPSVIPPSQSVALVVTWNTTSTDFVSETAVASAAQGPLANYINGVAVGQPMNVFELNAVFQSAVSLLVPTELLTTIIFNVSINGVGVLPVTGTGIINGDPESYFLTTTALITVNQA